MATKKAKRRTNKSALKLLVANLDPLEAVVLRERIVRIMKATKRSIAQDPESWDNPIFDRSVYIATAAKVEQYLGFGSDEAKK